jgi:ribosomal protein L35
MKQKTFKALAKRVRVTKNKKIMKRHCGQDHFNARASGNITRRKRRDNEFSTVFYKVVQELLPNN